MKFRLACLCILTFGLCLPLALVAQDTASVTGTVTDSSGAAVPGAQVTLTSKEHGINLSTTTNGSGDYIFGSLQIGAVDVTVTSKGFKKYQATGVVLRVGEKARVDVALQVGSEGTQVTVEGSGVAQVETQSSDLGGTVSGREITQLQLNGRDFKQLITLVPGVSNQNGTDEGGVGVTASTSFSINGGRTEYNNWEMDGGDTMDNGSNNTLNVTPSIDAIGEVKVLTSNYGAQYGKNGSGTIEVETKAGTSAFHGDAYEFIRNDAFDSAGFDQEGIVAPYKKNDFGFTIGGPLIIPHLYNKGRQKTFFFWSEEWRRDRVSYNFDPIVPSNAERAGDFSDQCQTATITVPGDCPVQPNFLPDGVTPNPSAGQFYPGNQVPFNASDPNVQSLLGLIPEQNRGTHFFENVAQPTNWREELFRIDHNLNDKERVTFRYIHDSWSQFQPIPLWTNAGSFPSIGTAFSGPGISMVARLSSTFSPTLLNEFVASYTSDKITLNDTGNYKRPANTTFGAIFPGADLGVMPGFNLNDPAGAYGGFGQDAGYIPNGVYNSNPSYSYKDNLTKILGKHNLQFGGYFEAAQKNEFGGELSAGSYPGFITFDPSSAVVTTGNPFADLLQGNIASFGQQNTTLKYYNRYKIVEPYFNDDWHVTSRLTLNLGLRLSLYGTYREKKDQAYNFDPAAYKFGITTVSTDDGSVTGLGVSDPTGVISVTNLPNGIVQCGGPGQYIGCQKGKLFNPAPRIGFAWDPRGNGKTAIRGGFGIFYEHGNGNETGTETLENSPPLAYAAQQNNIVGYENIGGGTAAPQFPLGVVAVPTKAIWPYVQQWHLDVQQEFAGNTVATISYVGSKGTHLTRQTDLNQLQPVSRANNPYKVGEAIGPNDCGATFDANGVPTGATTPSGVPITGQAAVNLGVAACGTNPDLFRPYAGYGDITYIQPASSSNYNAAQVAIRRNMGGLQLNFAYTFSHSIDDSSDRYDGSFTNAFDPAAQRASSNYDQRHVLNFGYVWDLPFFKSPGIAHKVAGGWEYSGVTTFNTGSPFSVLNPTDNAGVGNGLGSASYADIVGDPSKGVVNNGSTFVDQSGPLFFNPAAFAAPQGLTFGDSGRNLLRNPHQINFDMALFKHFAITESKAVEFRAEAFNVFNHTEWGAISGQSGSGASVSASGSNTLGDPNFLHTGGAHSPRILQLALKLLF
jgi:hypothetical protein